ncbi:hypothetical protein JOB18_022599 [Solea senegalensis]|uniref:Uncharacterized protein n=1 Tax=Solea senegalensis TaxID=28829 RepID=A0AAV6Q4K8_SOLSE|nr:hypothetical protein JOB18_022599 [Solea senegalensis]
MKESGPDCESEMSLAGVIPVHLSINLETISSVPYRMSKRKAIQGWDRILSLSPTSVCTGLSRGVCRMLPCLIRAETLKEMAVLQSPSPTPCQRESSALPSTPLALAN